MDKSKSRLYEFIRFLITGVACALLDYLTCQVVVLLLPSSINSSWITVVSTTAGFVIGVIANYIISTYWVYQNVDKSKNTKSAMFITLFVLLSFCALLLSIGAMLLCQIFCEKVVNIDIVEISLLGLIKENGLKFLLEGVFWAYFISFCIKTLVGLIWNYFTRKYILYKEPKVNE